MLFTLQVNSMFTQHEAMSSGMNAENGRRIAFMALLYLPISAVAVSLASINPAKSSMTTTLHMSG